MRSTETPEVDRSSRARIREAAFELFAAQGFGSVTVRTIAGRAGVSPALVIHHFGSVAALRGEIDGWVLDRFNRWMDRAASAASPEQMIDETTGEVRDLFRAEPLLGAYLRQLLVAGGEPGYEFFAQLFEAARRMLSALERRGLVRPAPRGADDARLMLLIAEDLGAMMLEPYLSRLLGTDIYSDAFMDRWRDAELDMHAQGLFAAPDGGTAS